MEKILVIMSTYNGEKYLKEQIESILNQKDVEIFLLVRDDGSKDKTLDVLRIFMNRTDHVSVIAGTNLGYAGSFISLVYSAFEYKDINYFAFADQDDIWLEDKLISAIKILRTADASKPLLYFSNALAVDENLKPLMECGGKEMLVKKSTQLVRYFMLGCTMVFNRNTVELLTKYPPTSKIYMHDVWLGLTCVFLGQVLYDPTYHIFYRQHSNNTEGVGNSWGIEFVDSKNPLRLTTDVTLESIMQKHFCQHMADYFPLRIKNLLNVWHYIRRVLLIELN